MNSRVPPATVDFPSTAGQLVPDDRQWADVLPAQAVPRNGGIRVRVGAQRLVVGAVDDDLFAIIDRCPHLDLPLAAFGPLALEGGRLVCPWHYWEFDVRSGRCEYAPFYQEEDLFFFQLEGRRGPAGESAGSLYHVPVRVRGDVVQVLMPAADRDEHLSLGEGKA